jgi:hypothetical protein
MDRAFSSGASGSAPTAPASPSMGYPTAGNPSTGTPATKPGPYWYHMITEELLAVISAAGITPTQGNLNQLLTALRSTGVFQTPAQFDNDTSLATTEFVQRALGNYSAYYGFTGTQALSAVHSGAYIKFTILLAATATLPSAVPNGVKFTITNAISSAATLTISIPGGIGSVLAGGNTTSFTLAPGSQAEFVHIGSGAYEAINGSGNASLGASGFQRMPSGMLMQWGTAMATIADFLVTFPIAFPTAVVSLAFGNNEARYGYYNNYLTTSGFKYSNRDLVSAAGAYPDNFFWIALGY